QQRQASQDNAKANARKGFKFKAITAAELDAEDYRMEWLIEGVMVRDQPCVAGGPKKVLKTSLLIDLALSLGSSTAFLGKFRVPQKLRTVLISGESGQATIQRTARQVALSKGVKLADCDCGFMFRLPQLSAEEDLMELTRGLRQGRWEVAIVDPLYLCLLS